MRLSAKEPNCRKSMNTLLHVMEAYTNFLRIDPAPRLRARQAELIRLFLDRILDPERRVLRPFFDDDWRPAAETDHVSPGHDIEASWLLVEAAEVLGEADLLAASRAAALEIAQAVYDYGRDADGAVIYSYGRAGGRDLSRHWWGQAEGVVGFYNAYQLSGRAHFAEAAAQLWRLIARDFIDREHGEWFKVLGPDGRPLAGQVKTGPWECPYHNGRLALEMRRRLESGDKETA